MAVEKYLSVQETPEYRGRPLDDHGKMRIQFFEVAALTILGDINSTFDLCELPPGAVRVLENLCYVETSAWGAGRLLDIGHRAYSKQAPDAAEEPQNQSAFALSIDVAAAGVKQFIPVSAKYDLYSRSGVKVFGTVRVGSVPIGATLRGFIVYVYE